MQYLRILCSVDIHDENIFINSKKNDILYAKQKNLEKYTVQTCLSELFQYVNKGVKR